MWQRNYSQVFTGVSRNNIWQLWTDINNWPTWHDDLEYCKMEGAFVAGNHFYLKPKGAPAVKIIITEINTGHSFTDCTIFFGAKMYNTHTVEETAEGLKLTNKLVVTGPLKWLWIKLVAQHIADSVTSETEALVNLARGMQDE